MLAQNKEKNDNVNRQTFPVEVMKNIKATKYYQAQYNNNKTSFNPNIRMAFNMGLPLKAPYFWQGKKVERSP